MIAFKTLSPKPRLLALVCAVIFSEFSLAATELCDSPNLIADATFETSNSTEVRNAWSAIEHSTPGSFAVSSEDGTLTIEKVGEEPWFIYRQRIKAKDFAGKTVRFSAQLKFDTDAPSEEGKVQHGAGMFFEVRNRSRRKVMGSIMDHEPNYGKTDWVPVTLEFKLPGNVLDVAPGFIHQANGSLQIKAPSLVAIEAVPCPDDESGQ
jgi:hypothetical protein